jgi:3-deoxy-7-phosphoheptulonate synthase
MVEPVENLNLGGFEPLVAPADVKNRAPASAATLEQVRKTRREIRAVLRGEDPKRLVVIVGPCSIHDPAAALEYAGRLAELKNELSDRLVILMRTYFEKPRTTLGWKGLINDPHLDGSCDIPTGLTRARETLLGINELGVPCGSELLDPVTPQYIADLLSWASIGARTTESQTHREMASGVSMPVGFKNGTDGSLDAAVNALISAAQPHAFVGINAEGITCVVRTRGNPDRHVVLRGGHSPNYGPEDVKRAAERVTRADPALERMVMIDTSHGNTEKDFTRQPEVVHAVVEQLRAGSREIMGLLIESNLVAGRQDWKQGTKLRHGVSITDGCIGWSDTEPLLRELASAVR